MTTSRLTWVVSISVLVALATAVSYWLGAYAQRRTEDRDLANTQAMLAFGHYKSYQQIETLLTRRCYEAAFTEARELKNLQLHLVSENLRAGGSDPELVEYIKVRDPKVVEVVLAGRVPEPKPYTTTCS